MPPAGRPIHNRDTITQLVTGTMTQIRRDNPEQAAGSESDDDSSSWASSHDGVYVGGDVGLAQGFGWADIAAAMPFATFGAMFWGAGHTVPLVAGLMVIIARLNYRSRGWFRYI
jgi:hypothetical protein